MDFKGVTSAYRPGERQIVLPVLDDELNGEYAAYYPPEFGGGVMSTGRFKSGFRVGVWIDYHADGSMHHFRTYDNLGRLIGASETWYSAEEGGGKKSVGMWRNGLADGLCELYDPMVAGGTIVCSRSYSNGVLHGPTTYINGCDNIIENYEHGKLRSRLLCQIMEVNVQSSDDLRRTSTVDIHRCTSDERIGPSCEDSSPRSVSSKESSPRDASSRESSPREKELHEMSQRVRSEEIIDPRVEPIELLPKRVTTLRLNH